MSECSACKKEMTTADGCIRIPIIHDRVEYEPVKIGDKSIWIQDDGHRCHDCGAKYGEYHHMGCDCEQCPICGGQLISCGCIDEEDPDDSEGVEQFI